MVPTLLTLSRMIDALTAWVGRAVAWLTLGMVLLGAGNAILRYLGRFVGENLTSNAVLEAQWYLFSLVFLLGAAPAVLQDRHVRVDVFYGRVSQRGQAWIDLLGALLFLIPFAWFSIWVSSPSIRNSIQVWEVSPDPGGLPRWPLKAVLHLCFGMLMAQGASEAIKRLAMLTGHLAFPEPAPEEAP